MIEPDAIAELVFRPRSEGGRRVPTPTDRLGCILCIGEDCFDCFVLPGALGPIHAGETREVGLKFLHPDLLRTRLRAGTRFNLRELRVFADGVVKSVHWQETEQKNGSKSKVS